MRITRIEIQKFRNHSHSILDCAEGINAVLGDNGEGKTNLVEAISYLCLTKSFYASADAVVLRLGDDRFDLRGEFVSDHGTRSIVRVKYEAEPGKKTVEVNGSPVETLASIIGRFPVVVLAPEQSGITLGPPTERRKFLDLVISQSAKLYLEQLIEYRRILKQRNKVLLQGKLMRKDCSEELEPWNESLVHAGADLIRRRAQVISEIVPLVQEAYERLAGSREHPAINYAPSVGAPDLEDVEAIRKAFRLELDLHVDEERRLGSSVVGPHRDELELLINEMSLRKFASQGQHKTFLVALKLAEFAYLKEQCGETPMLLLDDVFSELDEHRSEKLLRHVAGLGQVFITTTDESVFSTGIHWSDANRRVVIRGGEIVDAQRIALAG